MSKDLCYFIDGSENVDKGFGPICRVKTTKDGLKRNYWENCYTIYDLFRYGVEKHPKELCIGKRELKNDKLDDHFTFITYEETGKLIYAMAAALLEGKFIKEIPFNDHKTPGGTNYRLVGIFSRNRMEWLIAEHALFSVNAAALPLYDTFGPDAIRFIFGETGIETTFCSNNELKLLLTIIKEKDSKILLKNLILFDNIIPNDCKELIKSINVNIYIFNDLLNNNKNKNFIPNPPNELDPAFIFYTSGTTGPPKGVIMLHQNLASLSQAGLAHHPDIYFPPGHYYLSYLPMPHVFEQFIHGIILSSGGAIGFFSGDKNLVLEDIKVLRPTIFASVPRIFNRMKDKVLDNVQKTGGIKGWLFNKAIKSKLNNLKNNSVKSCLYDSLVLHKVRGILGFDRLSLAVTGSAPISNDSLSFLKCLLCCPVLQGFGMTESGGGVCCSWPGDMTTSSDCGNIVQSCEMRLISVPDMGYRVTDPYHGRIEENGKVIVEGSPCYGRGELVYRGYNRTPGYFRRPDLTKESIDSDGWFHTGDVALISTEYKLQIIDRIKNILKLSQGEYVAIENLENYYQASLYIDQIFVYGDSFQSCLVAIIVPDESTAKQWAISHNITDFSLNTLCTSKEFKQFIISELENIAKQKKLNGIERLRNIYLESVPFSVDDGTLTPTMKLRRNDLKKKYQSIIEGLYKSMINTNTNTRK